MMPIPNDLTEGRLGPWMHTSLGGRFYPQDPRPEEIFISDIANGLAMCNRYAGQNQVDRFYSVAEHCVHMTRYAYLTVRWPLRACFAVLLHDAAEAYTNDLARAVKVSVGDGYKQLERRIEEVIFDKYEVSYIAQEWASEIKQLDVRMVPTEKAAIMRHQIPWAFDEFEPLSVEIQCWSPAEAKQGWLDWYVLLASELLPTIEATEI